MTLPSTLKLKKSNNEDGLLPSTLKLKEKKPKENNAEGFWKSAFRTALQIPQGIAEATPSGIATGLWQLLGQGAALDPEEIERIKEISEREGIPFDEESYMKAAENALKYVPTVSNISREIEERTGLPLEPRDKFQKAIRLGSTAGKFQPGAIAQKAVAAGVAPLTKEGLEYAGVPEFLSEPTSLGIATGAGFKAPAIDIGKAKKPSGLPSRQFEKLQKPVEVSPKKIKQIDEKLESDFRDIASDIIEKSPINETHSELKNDAGFKVATEEAFEKIERLAESIPEKIDTLDLKKSLVNRVLKEKNAGITPLEFDKVHHKFIKEFINDTKGKEASTIGLLKQFRKNNKAYGKSWEPGKSSDYNVAKRQALLDYNRTIADIFEKKFPDTEFSNLFKSTNEKWAKIMDAEAIDAYIDDIFKGKINYKKDGKLFNDRQKQIFKRSLGEEGYKNFEQLNKDLMSTEKAHKLMKVAQEKGYKDLTKLGLSYLLHPKLAIAKLGYGIAKNTYQTLWQSLLDKPQLALTWDKGIKAFKKADFATAEKQLNKLKDEVEIFKSDKKDFSDKPKKEPMELDITPEKPKAEQRLIEEKPVKNVSTKKPKRKAPKIDWDAVEKTLEDIHRRDYKEPISTPKVLKENLPEIKKQDISKSGLRNQKEFILFNLEDAIANPDKFKNEKFINLSVPGDGEFKIKNDPKALAQFYKSVKSKWPDKPLRKSPKSKDIQYPDYAYKEYEIATEKKRNDFLNSQTGQSQSSRKKPKK